MAGVPKGFAGDVQEVMFWRGLLRSFSAGRETDRFTELPRFRAIARTQSGT